MFRNGRICNIDYIAGLINHGLLFGLGDDDHTHYLLASGARALAGNWNLGGFNLTNGGAITGTSLTLDFSTQDYILTNRGGVAFVLQSQTSNQSPFFDIFTQDGDGVSSEEVYVTLWGKGLPSGVNDSEALVHAYTPTGVKSYSFANGTGTIQPYSLYTGGNTTQLVLNTDNSIDMSGDLGVAGGLTADTTTLVVDAVNHRVGIGTTSPQGKFNVARTDAKYLKFDIDSSNSTITSVTNHLIFDTTEATDDIIFKGNGAELFRIDSGVPTLAITGDRLQFSESRGFIYDASANKIGIVTDASMVFANSALVVDASGNVGIGTTSPTSALQMGDDKLVAFDTNAGITASTFHFQGQGALTAQINEISTVANKDDTVTLPTAVTGVPVEIINNGANTLWIFPASGDDLGLGVNTKEELEANERVKFVAYDTTNWAKESTTEIIHAEIHDEDNTDAFVINDAGGDFHSYHTNGLAAGDLADWAFDAGGAGTSHAIDSIADGADSGVDIAVTTADNHLLEDGDIVSQTNLATAAYVGIFVVKDIISATIYEVAAVFDDDVTGTMDQAATLEADAVAAGVYSFAYCVSATPVGNNETFDFQLYKDATAIVGSKIRRKFGAGGDFGSMSGCGVISVGSGEKISFALSNEDSAANLIVRNLTIVLVRL